MCEQLFIDPHVESGSSFASDHIFVVRSQPDVDYDLFFHATIATLMSLYQFTVTISRMIHILVFMQ